MPLNGDSGLTTAAGEEAVSVSVQKAAMPFFATRIKVYPKRVHGIVRNAKWAILVACLSAYYLVPWIRWDRGPGAPSQAILLDLPGRRAYFFGIEIWPQEIYFLTGLLILAAIGLFLVSSLFGRVWCGYACPQTVWTDLFMWVERRIEGDRNARIKLDRQGWSVDKALRKTAKHTAWLLISLATGGAWVMYYVDAPTALREIFTGRASAEVYFFVGLFTATTYLLAGWAREQVCTYMCPWPRFQAAMFDENTVTVTYESWRGEPRGSHKPSESWEGKGDCVDCKQCIAACPTGIDIRDGQQLECIGCGLCIDACNEIMDKVGRPRGLIAFDTLANQAAKAARRPVAYKLIRPRVIVYAAMLALAGSVMLGAFLLRPTITLTVLRDRAPLFVPLSDGGIRNGFTIKVVNKTRQPQHFALTVAGLGQAAIHVVAAGDAENAGREASIAADPDSVATYRVYVAVPAATLTADATPIEFRLEDQAKRPRASHDSVFRGPDPRSHGPTR